MTKPNFYDLCILQQNTFRSGIVRKSYFEEALHVWKNIGHHHCKWMWHKIYHAAHWNQDGIRGDNHNCWSIHIDTYLRNAKYLSGFAEFFACMQTHFNLETLMVQQNRTKKLQNFVFSKQLVKVENIITFNEIINFLSEWDHVAVVFKLQLATSW